MPSRLSRRGFSAATLAAIGSLVVHTPARAADFTFKFGTDNAVSHPSNIHGKQIFEEIRKATNGRVDIQLFPDSALGGTSAMFSQVRSGALQFMLNDGAVIASVVDVAAIQGIGFAFKSSQQAFAAFDGELGTYVRKEIESKGLYCFEKIFLNGMREVTSSTRPIAAPADLKNFKIRTPPAKISVELFKALGASPSPINFNEVYTALQTHVVDGQENPLTNIETAKLYEVQKYLSFTNHMWSGYWLIGNKEAWNSLPSDLQAIVAKGFSKFADLQRRDVDAMNNGLADKLVGQGMKINRPEAEPFRATLGAFYAAYRTEFGATAWSLLEKYSGKLG